MNLAKSFAFSISQISNAQEPKSIRQLQYEEYSRYGFTKQEQWDSLYLAQHPGAMMPQAPVMQKSQGCNLTKRVFGWHPFWLASNEYLNYDYSLLSDLSFFGYDVDPYSGYATSTHGWLTSPVVTNALNAGIRVNLCVVMFSNHATLLNNATSKQNLINSLISNVKQRGAHGVNIDFEGMSPSTSASFHAFMISLSQQMHASVVYNKPTMAVDTHVFRVSARIGLTVGAKNPLQTEMQLIKYIPEEKISIAHHWLILHGRYVCVARNPKCPECGIKIFCRYFEKITPITKK